MLREKCMNACMNFIKENKDFDETKLEEIQYGLEAIYITLEKSVVIFTVAFILGIVKELLILLLFYNLIRMPSFGLHATKSSICLISSLLMFIGGTFLIKYLIIPFAFKYIIGVISFLLILKNAPADTYKRPIVSPRRRMTYKIISSLVALIYVILCLCIKDNLISNAMLLSLVIQNCMISPTVYKMFNLPYDNYKTYILETV